MTAELLALSRGCLGSSCFGIIVLLDFSGAMTNNV